MLKSGEARTPDRLRHRRAAEPHRRLDRARQVHEGEAAGGAEDAERALWRVAFMRANSDATVKLIADLYEIPPEIAALEYENTIMKLETDGSMSAPNVKDAVQLSLDMAKLGGMKDLRRPRKSTRRSSSRCRPRTLRHRDARHVRTIIRCARSRSSWRSSRCGRCLPRTGIVNPRLLPSAVRYAGDAWPTSLQRAQRAQRSRRCTASEVLAAFILAVPCGAPIGLLIAENHYFADSVEAAAVLRVQHPEIDLPADVHPGVRHRLRRRRSASAFFSTIFIVIMSDDGGGGIGQGRSSAGGALLRRDAAADRVPRLSAEHAADPAGSAAHLDDLQFHRRDARRDVCLAHRHRPSDRDLGRELPDAAAVRRRGPARGDRHRPSTNRCAGWKRDAAHWRT